MASGPLRYQWPHNDDFPNLLSLPSVFRCRGMRVELCQRCGLVGNLADLLGNPVELAMSRLFETD